MFVLVLGLIVFLVTHSLSIVAPGRRDALVSSMGLLPYRAAHSIASVVGLFLIVWGYGMARDAPVVLYDPPLAMRHVTLTLMIFVFPLLFAAYLPGRIKKATKHPMLAAVKIWAFAHLLANGTLADVVLFGTILAWAVVDRISLKRRAAPVVVEGSTRNDVMAVVLGLVVYAIFVLFAHAWLFGVSPLG